MVKLCEALNPKNKGGTSKEKNPEKISLNYNQITEIDTSSFSVLQQKNYQNVRKLFLGHNQLETLKGIGFFKNLTHLSVSNNKLKSIEEFAKIKNPSLVECLAVKGNRLVERHPDFQSLLITFFPNLKELDSVNLLAKSAESSP